MELNDIQILVENGNLEDAKKLLDSYISENPNCENAYFLLGKIFRRQEDWQNAINAFQKAIDINPESPAVAAKDNIYKILEFYNKDMFNQ